MPAIFIHGVNTRDTDENYEKDVAARNELLQRHILGPLAVLGDRFKQLAIVNVYWGKHGVDFRWRQASLPDVRALEHLGAGAEGTPEADFELTETAKEMAGRPAPGAPELELLGAETSLLKRAAEKDLTRFVEAVISPLILAEMRLGEDAGVTPRMEGVLQALLATAAVDVASSPEVKAKAAAADSDEELMNLLKEKVQARFEELARSALAPPAGVTPAESPLEPLGPDWWQSVTTRIGELFDRAKDAPGRMASISALDLFREKLHRNLSRFLGDVFVYLNERGDRTQPGPIVATVLQAIRTAPRHHAEEPLIVITHSMGGNILYDILTYYAPDLKVDIWVSVGGQVAQFEEMKLFRASDKAVGDPDKVTGLKPRLGYWLNVYDPADSFSFKTTPVFADVDADVEYLTGASALKAHSEYFGRASFYRMMWEHIEQTLL